MRIGIVLVGLALTAPTAAAWEPAELVRTSAHGLNALYASGSLAPAPTGFAAGTAIFDPGTPKAVRKARRTGLLWKGKVFTPDGIMINRLAGGLEAVQARVFVTDSWYDGQPTLVFDYCGTSKVFGNVRDEVREIEPGLYLGLTYLRQRCGPPELSNYFVLDARCPCR